MSTQQVEADNYVYRQNGGCGIRIYPNGIDDGRPDKVDLFFDIRQARAARETTDVAGSFSFTLLPTAPWDEIIQPDDFCRIFMGDQVVASDKSNVAYNFASGSLALSSSGFLPSINPSTLLIPLPPDGLKVSNGAVQVSGLKAGLLVVYERMLGKVDRVNRIKSQDGATTVGFQVMGRSMGSIVQDISLYYNEFLEPLNAVNIFLQTSAANLDAAPDEILREILAVVLTSVPFPQWILPDALVADLNFLIDGVSIKDKNKQFVDAKLSDFKQRLEQFKTSPQIANKYKGDVLVQMQALLAQAGEISNNSPFAVISLDGLLPCFGGNFNRSMLNSVTTGFGDMLKAMSNPTFNEFYFDLCPDGQASADAGTALDGTPVPTFVLRQHPRNITDDLLAGIAPFLAPAAETAQQFPEVPLDGISASLIDLMPGSFSVFGPMAQPKLSLKGSFAKYADDETNGGYTPTILGDGYDCGYSSHDRLNSFLVLGSYNVGQATASSRIIAAEAGGFLMNVESIRKYGIRVLEVSTQYAQPNGSSVQESDIGETLATFSKTLANWYFMNEKFLNGRLRCRFLKRARIGVPVKYWETRITPDNPYPKLELFYVQGAEDDYSFGQPITTTLTVVRGLRYKVSDGGPSLAGVAASILGGLLS